MGSRMNNDHENYETAISEFCVRFKSKLAHRAQTMEIMARYYLNHCEERPVIIETGTARKAGNFAGDGQSTIVFDFLAQQHEQGAVLSIDIDQKALTTAEIQCSDRTKFMCADSVYALSNTDHELLDMCGLLYLDSFDLDIQNPWPSAIHHLKELTAVYSNLPIGCMIVVDDCVSESVGKHILVAEFLAQTDAALVQKNYQWLWIKR